MEETGYVYCLTNPSMPGLVKVGMTKRDPQERLKEANKHNTFGPPTPYELKIVKKVKGYKEKEKQIHKLLEKYAERVSQNYEFFRATLLIVRIVFAMITAKPKNDTIRAFFGKKA